MKKMLITTSIVMFLAGLLPSYVRAGDFGGAPEGVMAYPTYFPIHGVFGSFPTCIDVGPASWIEHLSSGNIYLGSAVSFEEDGNGGLCPLFDPYNKDELPEPILPPPSGLRKPRGNTIKKVTNIFGFPPPGFRFFVEPLNTYNHPLGKTCEEAVWGQYGGNIDIWVSNWSGGDAYVNVLMDWNQDGEWGGTSQCQLYGSIPEHVMEDFHVPYGGTGLLSELNPPPFRIGPNPSYVWTRFTITSEKVGPDWNGEGVFDHGETEDYLLLIDPVLPVDPLDPGTAPDASIPSTVKKPKVDYTCWIAGAANMLAAAGYGNMSTLQENAEQIYSQIMEFGTMRILINPDEQVAICTDRGTCDSGWKGNRCANDVECGPGGSCDMATPSHPDWKYHCQAGATATALQWWIKTYGGDYPNNKYKRVNVYGSYFSQPWQNPNGPRDIGDWLRGDVHGNNIYVSLGILPPGAGLGHVVTAWGDNGGGPNILTHKPDRIIVSDNARISCNFGDNTNIHYYTYDDFNNPNPNGENHGPGWYIDYGTFNNHPYIYYVTTLEALKYSYWGPDNPKVMLLGVFSETVENNTGWEALQLFYRFGGTVQNPENSNIIYYNTTIDVDIPGYNVRHLKAPTIVEKYGYPPQEIEFRWDFTHCVFDCGESHRIPPGTKVTIRVECIQPPSAGEGVRFLAANFMYGPPSALSQSSEPSQAPALEWKVTSLPVTGPEVTNIVGGYLIGKYKIYSVPEDELIIERRFLKQYTYEEDPEKYIFELHAAAEDPQTYTIRELSFGHSYGLLDNESLWAFDDWMTVESDQTLLPEETIVVNIDWENLLPYPSIDYASFTAADFDEDGNVDADDFTLFSDCFSGLGVPVAIECFSADFDLDGDIDCYDWAQFMYLWTEPEDLPEFLLCTPDSDLDGIPDPLDNCSDSHNSFQEDTSPPPQGNGIGDACDCEGNFDCDQDCDGSDAAKFKNDFGRSTFNNPCEGANPCNGDFDCDVDVDGTDASLLKSDFGRSSFNNPCPACTEGDWCDYGQMVTIAPAIATECPEVPTECPEVATECPSVFTECPLITTQCPEVPTACPEIATVCPELPTECPVTTTTTTILVNRFTDNGDGTVTDTHSGLVWLKDADCFVYLNWADALSQAASLASGTCGLTDGSSAGDWRLPTKTEWEEFYCPQYNSPAICNTAGTGQWTEGDPFNNVVHSLYWSSTEYDQDWAWCVDMNNPKTYAYLKTGELFFWPVRDPSGTTTTTTVPSTGIRYTLDFLESGNPGGWTSSFKTFDDSWNMPLSSEVDADIWLNDCPENMVAAGFYMEYDTTRIDVFSVEAYDNSGLSGPWDPFASNIIPDANGPGTYVVIVGNFAGVPPDAGGDIVIAKVRLRLTEPLQTDITFSPIPGLPTVGDVFGYLYDPEIDPKTVSIDIP